MGFYKGQIFTSEHRMRLRLAKLGKKGVPRTEEWKRKIGDAQRGEKANNWRGGITPLNKVIRRSQEYKDWREKVFKRDDWTCQNCGERGGQLHPHHIKPFASFPELRFEVQNGQTLCVDCHKKTPTYALNIKYHYQEILKLKLC